MSLTSVELNYLIWRYLQESGFDLAAYALSKDSACLDYEHDQNKLISEIQPGCLVNLVQKGILYTFLEDSSEDKKDRLNLIEAIVKDKAVFEASGGAHQGETDKPNDKSTTGGASMNGEHSTEAGIDIDMKDAEGPVIGESSDKESASEDVEFQTISLPKYLEFAPSVVCDWHPTTDVFAFGQDDSTAVIDALGPDGVAESVTLHHPPVIVDDVPQPNSIVAVSWSPEGNMVLTAGTNGEIRAWTPDGRLKNIVNSVVDGGHAPAPVQSIIWNVRGSLVLSIDIQNSVSVWEGSTLAPVSMLKGAEQPVSSEIHACWVSDSKFAVTTRKNGIRIYSLNTSMPYTENLIPVGHLQGHENDISSLCFNPVSKLLASASDVDYAIKVWNSSSSSEALELNVIPEKVPHLHYHTTPIITLEWLCRPGDVQGNELLSVSMEGSVNIWDAFTGDSLVSANIFKNPENFHHPENSDTIINMKNSLVYAAAASPNARFLAIGDDSGNISIWDIQSSRYKNGQDLLRCLGLYAVEKPGDFGVCELAWDSRSQHLNACFNGTESLIFKWDSH